MVAVSKHAILAMKLERQRADLEKRLDAFSDTLKEIREVTLPALNERARDLDWEQDDRRAIKIESGIRDDIRLINQNIFLVRRFAYEIAEIAESVERESNFTYHSSQDVDQTLYRVTEGRRERGGGRPL